MKGQITPQQRFIVRLIKELAPLTYKRMQDKAHWEGVTFFALLEEWPSLMNDAHDELAARHKAGDRLLVAADDAADFFSKLGKNEYATGLANECALYRKASRNG